MRFVQHPAIRPHRCAMLPHISASNEPQGFFDAGTDLDLEHVYVSGTAFREMARIAGFVHHKSLAPAEDRLRRELADALERAERAEERAAAAEAKVAAVEVLKAGGFTAARRPGRPKKETDRVVEAKEKVTA